MTVRAFAKVNLTLEVLGLRSDGYHALRSVVLPVSLADTLTLDPAEKPTSDSGYPDDLMLKAARALGVGAAIRVEKQIPVGGGLGGGSADAAAVLRALNALYGLGKSIEELAAIGARVGSDVPALVLGGPVLMEGRGERVSRLADLAHELNLVLVNPGVFCSTAEVYARCAARAATAPSATAAMIAALRTGEFAAIAAALANDLQAPAMRLHPEIASAARALAEAGASATLMSGSGSTVFGLVRTAREARTVAEILRTRNFLAWPAKSVPATAENMI